MRMTLPAGSIGLEVADRKRRYCGVALSVQVAERRAVLRSNGGKSVLRPPVRGLTLIRPPFVKR